MVRDTSRRAQRRLLAVAATACSILPIACSGDSPTGPELIVGPSEAVSLQGNSTLVFQGPAAFGAHRDRVEEIVRDTLAAAAERIPLPGITIILDAPSEDNIIPEIGMGGRATAGTIRMTFDTEGSVWVGALETHLFSLLAHEMHHVARFRALGFYDHLLDGMVGEGLADQFSVDLADIAPPLWSSALTPEQLAVWRQRAREQWFNESYDHNAWFFGTTSEIPRWTGYTIGFVLTGEFLADNPTRSAAGLYAEPSASFGR